MELTGRCFGQLRIEGRTALLVFVLFRPQLLDFTDKVRDELAEGVQRIQRGESLSIPPHDVELIDIQGKSVMVQVDGTVVRLPLGKSIFLRHGYGVETKYGHLKEVLVSEGDKVRRGQKIGLMGSTGRSTGPHLHYQIEVERKPVNPRNYILEEEE